MATPSRLSRVIESQGQNMKILSIKDQVKSNIDGERWAIHTDGSLRYRGRVVVPQLADLREKILIEFHCSCFVVHIGGTKMHHELRRQYYWSDMKKHIKEFVHHYLTCQQVKTSTRGQRDYSSPWR